MRFFILAVPERLVRDFLAVISQSTSRGAALVVVGLPRLALMRRVALVETAAMV
jgi:hypothetical protein